MNAPPLSSTRRFARTTAVVAAAGVLGTASLLFAGTGPATAQPASATVPAVAAAKDTTPPKVHYVKFSRRTVKVSGLKVVPVRVSVRLSDPSGIDDGPRDLDRGISVALGPVPGFKSTVVPQFKRTWGTPRNGIWSAVVHVPSTWNGTVKVVGVGVGDRAGNRIGNWRPGPKGPKLRVKGTHRPALTFRYSVLKGGGFRIHGRAYFTDTGRPIGHRALATSYEMGCLMRGVVRNTIRTNARGYYQQRYPKGENRGVGCVALVGKRAPGQPSTLIAYRVGSTPR